MDLYCFVKRSCVESYFVGSVEPVARLWTVGWSLRLLGSVDKVPDVSSAALGCGRQSVVVVGVVVCTVVGTVGVTVVVTGITVSVIVVVIVVIGCVPVASFGVVSVVVIRPVVNIVIVIDKTSHVIVVVVTVVTGMQPLVNIQGGYKKGDQGPQVDREQKG